MNVPLPFADRAAAGRLLGAAMAERKLPPNVRVLGLPRGGIPVAAAVAELLRAPLDVVVVRKLGVPWEPEAALGAVAEDGEPEWDRRLIVALGISTLELEALVARERAELQRRVRLYRHGRPPLPVAGRDVILVDDGLATGLTMLAAVHQVRRQQPKRMIAAVPVGTREGCDQLTHEGCEVVCLATPEPFGAVGRWYGDFRQVSDAEVRRLLG